MVWAGRERERQRERVRDRGRKRLDIYIYEMRTQRPCPRHTDKSDRGSCRQDDYPDTEAVGSWQGPLEASRAKRLISSEENRKWDKAIVPYTFAQLSR